MEQLSFATGLKEFDLNGKQVIKFIPTDAGLMSRIYSAFESLDKEQAQYTRTGDDQQDAKAFFDKVLEMDERMQETIDGIFGVHISRDVFDGGSLHAVADGLPLWANFLFAVMDVMDVSAQAEAKAQNPRIQKLIAKYKR